MSMSLQGKNICFTGVVDGFTRAELQEIANEYKFNFQTSVTRNTHILVVGKDAGDVKQKKATQLGIKIWSADDFLMMLGQDDADGIPDVLSPKRAKEAHKAGEPSRAAFYEKDPEVGMF